MLEQLVYTRGRPRIDLDAGGRQIPTDGFGVSNISRGLLDRLSSESRRKFVLERAAIKNGSNEMSVGLFDSYEYNLVDEGTYLLSYEFSRPCSPDLSVPGSSRLSGIFVKQCLLGVPGGYPYEWIGSDVWTAWRLADADYRRDTLPEPLPAVPETVSGGSIRLEDIDAFLSDGRAECAASALGFVLRQFALPEEERHVLVIRDTPERVALWVAAIQRALPVEMARQITFATNRTRLSIQPEPVLFAYTTRTAPDGRAIRSRRPYCMIVGCHPKDPTCSSLTAGPASRFSLLSGSDRTLVPRPEFTEEETRFLSTAIRRGEDVQAFFRRPFGRLPLDRAAASLPRLFTADTWLRGDAAADYEGVLGYMRELSGTAQTDPDLCREAAGRAMEALAEHLETDERRNWALAQYCAPLARQAGRGGEFVSLLLSYLIYDLPPRGSASRIVALERASGRGELPGCMEPVEDSLFSGDYLALFGDLIARDQLDRPAVAALTRLFLSRLAAHGVTDDAIVRSEASMTLLRRALVALSAGGAELWDILSSLARRPALLEALAVLVTSDLGKRDEQTRSAWLQAIFTIPGYDPLSLYERLRSAGKIEPAALESLLVTILDQPDSDPRAVLDTFRGLVRSGAGVNGAAFCRALLERAPREDLAPLIREIRKLDLPLNAQRSILLHADTLTDYPTSRQTPPELLFLRSWGSELSRGVTCVSTVAELTEFCHDFCSTRSVREALRSVERVAALAPHLLPDERYWHGSDCFPALVRHAAEFRSAELHAALLTMFGDAPVDLGSYFDAYIALLIPAGEGLTAGFSRLLSKNRTDPGMQQAAILLRSARGLVRLNGRSSRRDSDLIRQCTQRALLRRGDRRLRRDLDAMEANDPEDAAELRRLIGFRD